MKYLNVTFIVVLLTLFVWKWFSYSSWSRSQEKNKWKTVGSAIGLFVDFIFVLMLFPLGELVLSLVNGSFFVADDGRGGAGAVFFVGWFLLQIQILLAIVGSILTYFVMKGRRLALINILFYILYLLPLVMIIMYSSGAVN